MDDRRGDLDYSTVIDVVERRAELLGQLADGPKHKPELRDALGYHRSTVYKAVRELERCGLVGRTDEGYEVTLMGQLLLEEYERFVARVESVIGPAKVLSILPPDADLPIDVLDGATTMLTEPSDPNRPEYAFDEILRSVTVLKATSAIVLPYSVEIVNERTIAGDLEIDLVLTRPVIERLATEYTEQVRAALSSGNVTIRETEETLHYGMLLGEEPSAEVAIVVYGPSGEVKGVIKNDADAALEWARSAWDRHERRSHRLAPSDVVDEFGSR